MNEMDLNLAQFFDNLSEPIISLDGGIIRFMNTAAIGEFGAYTGQPATLLLPEALLQLSPEMAGAAWVGGVGVSVRAADFGDCRVLILKPDTQRATKPVPLPSIDSELRAQLANIRLAADHLGTQAQRIGDRNLRTSLSILNHSYYQLRRLVLNSAIANAIQRGDAFFLPSRQNLSRLCRELVDTVSFFAARHGVSISFTASSEQLEASVDRELIERLLFNLLSESLLQTPEGGEIRVSLTEEGGRLLLSVDDNGRGLSQERLAQVFEPDTPLDRENIGICLVRRITELHGGVFLLESREGVGSSARVTLPMDLKDSQLFRSAELSYRTNGMETALTQLSTWLTAEDYNVKLMD